MWDLMKNRTPRLSKAYSCWKRPAAEEECKKRGISIGPKSGPNYLSLARLRELCKEHDEGGSQSVQQPSQQPASTQPAATSTQQSSQMQSSQPEHVATSTEEPAARTGSTVTAGLSTALKRARSRSTSRDRKRVVVQPLTQIVWDDESNSCDSSDIQVETRVPLIQIPDEAADTSSNTVVQKVNGVRVSTLQGYRKDHPWLCWTEGRIFCCTCGIDFTNTTQLKRDTRRHAKTPFIRHIRHNRAKVCL